MSQPLVPGPGSPSGWYQDPDDPAWRRFYDSRKQDWTPSRKRATKQDETAWQAKVQTHDNTPGQHQLVCPHCGTKGTVRSKQVRMKKGVSGGKAAGAVLTAGLSVLATGLSRKEKVTEMRCSNCLTAWVV